MSLYRATPRNTKALARSGSTTFKWIKDDHLLLPMSCKMNALSQNNLQRHVHGVKRLLSLIKEAASLNFRLSDGSSGV